MKEVLFLPTNTETLFQPLPKQLDKRPFPEEGMSFRDYLEQAKSAPEKPIATEIDRKANQVQKEESKSSLPSDDVKPEVEREEDLSSKFSCEDQTTPVLASQQEAAFVVGIPNPELFLGPEEVSAASLEDGLGKESVPGMAEASHSLATDLLLMNSLSNQPKATEISQNAATDTAFTQLLQSRNEPASAPEAVKKDNQAAVHPKANGNVEQNNEINNKDNPAQFAEGSKEIGKATVSQTSESVSNKSPEAPSTMAQSQASRQSMVTEVNPLKKEGVQSPVANEGAKTEAQSPVVKEGAKPEAAQASGPPLNPSATKAMEPARLAEAHRPDIVQQVTRELEVFGKSGQTSLRIQLYPEQLGRIDVRLISRAEGVQIVLHADNASTAFLLERDLSTLRESLVQAGVNLSGLSVGHGQTHNPSDFAHSGLRSSDQSAEKFGSSVQLDEPMVESSKRGWRDSSSTVDYRI